MKRKRFNANGAAAIACAILLALFLVVMSATQSCAPEERTAEQQRIDKFLNDCELVDNGQWQFSEAAGR